MKSASRIPGGVWALGFVSMFMDISSEMIHSLLPVFLVSVLGASTTAVGLIEGIGEATASISKLFSGWISDRIGKRKLLTVIGYGLGALSKPFFAIAPSTSWVLAARFADRLGKGIRGAPRDALVGDLAPQAMRGAAYGLRQSLDTVGAFAGPLLALLLMAAFDNDFRLIFWIAVIPGLAAVAILILAVREPPAVTAVAKSHVPIEWSQIKRFESAFWLTVTVGTILTLARFSEAFLILRAQSVGLTLALIPLVLIIMNIVYAITSYPIGILSDRIDRKLLLAAGFAVLILSDIVLALASGIVTVMFGVGLWGLHMGMTQGLLAALIADTAPADFRGTAFGLFNAITGVALLLASLIAGLLWELIGPQATFFAGAALTAAGLFAMVLFMNHRRK